MWLVYFSNTKSFKVEYSLKYSPSLLGTHGNYAFTTTFIKLSRYAVNHFPEVGMQCNTNTSKPAFNPLA